MAECSGRPKTFESDDEIIKLYCQFCDEVEKGGYDKLPTMSAFAKWLQENGFSADRRTVYRTLNVYNPGAKDEVNAIFADFCITGAALSKYQASSIIFGLKNWVRWSDRQDVDVKASTTINGLSEADKKIIENIAKKLGVVEHDII